MQVTTRKITTLAATTYALGSGTLATQAAAPATPQGFINFRTYPSDQRVAIRARTAVPDGSFYPKRAEGPYNGYPGPDSGDDDTKPLADYREGYNIPLTLSKRKAHTPTLREQKALQTSPSPRRPSSFERNNNLLSVI